ncbi:MAG TPA: thioredoxin [Myxococcota bacterium]|nr:thioredoxin [Myxococcota bacterium]HQP95051.1 thioredoxin [Myxococcota bacterium]
MANSENILEFTDSGFKAEVLESTKPVLVDFWAPWCGPCRAIAPMIAQIADEYAGRVKVGKMNVDQNIAVAGNYGISAIPTLIFVKNGKVVDQLVGAADKAKITARLDKLLG